MEMQIVEEWTSVTQILLDDNGERVQSNGKDYIVDDYTNDFPTYTVQDKETGENLETFHTFEEARRFKAKYERTENITQLITKWVKANFDDEEVENPSWNIELLAQYLSDNLEK